MFLHDLTDNGYCRTLFLECAYILLAVGNSHEYFEIQKNMWIDKEYKAKFLTDKSIFLILEKYAKIFDQNINEENYYYLKNEKNYSKFLEDGIMRDYDGAYKIDEKYTHIDLLGGHSSSVLAYRHVTFEGSVEKPTKESYFPYLFSAFGYFMQRILDEIRIKDSTENSQIALEQLMWGDVDSYNDSHEIFYKEILSSPEIRVNVFCGVLDLILDIKSRYLVNMNGKEKKVIIFELIKLCIINGKFNALEKSLMKKISQALNIDVEYLEEFEDVIGRILAVKKEAKELINE